MKRLAALVTLIAVTAQFAAAQQGAAELEKKIGELRARLGEVERGLQQASARLGLVAGRDKGALPQDEEIAKLHEQAETARKAVETKTIEILKADPEASKIIARIEEIKATRENLEKELKEAEKSLGPISERLGLAGGRGKKAEGAAGENPEIAALRQAAQAAQKALEDKRLERLRADPEGNRLVAEREQIHREIEELQRQARGGKERK